MTKEEAIKLLEKIITEAPIGDQTVDDISTIIADIEEGTWDYYPLKDGYEVGDMIQVGGYKYEVLEIEAFNQIMLIEEIDEPLKWKKRIGEK